MEEYNVEGRLITKDDWEKWLKTREEYFDKCLSNIPEPSVKKESRYAVIEWHKYPHDKPYCDDNYLVSVKIGKSEYVTVSMYFDDEFENFHDCEVMAWAEMPEPYKEENNE